MARNSLKTTTERYRAPCGIDVYTYVGDINNIPDATAAVTGEGVGFENESFITQALLGICPDFRRTRDTVKRKNRSLKAWNVRTSKLNHESKFRYIFHAVLKHQRDDYWIEGVKKLYKRLFKKVEKYEVSKLALPLLGSGRARADISDAVRAVSESITLIPNTHRRHLQKIYLVTMDTQYADSMATYCQLYFQNPSDAKPHRRASLRYRMGLGGNKFRDGDTHLPDPKAPRQRSSSLPSRGKSRPQNESGSMRGHSSQSRTVMDPSFFTMPHSEQNAQVKNQQFSQRSMPLQHVQSHEEQPIRGTHTDQNTHTDRTQHRDHQTQPSKLNVQGQQQYRQEQHDHPLPQRLETVQIHDERDRDTAQLREGKHVIETGRTDRSTSDTTRYGGAADGTHDRATNQEQEARYVREQPNSYSIPGGRELKPKENDGFYTNKGTSSLREVRYTQIKTRQHDTVAGSRVGEANLENGVTGQGQETNRAKTRRADRVFKTESDVNRTAEIKNGPEHRDYSGIENLKSDRTGERRMKETNLYNGVDSVAKQYTQEEYDHHLPQRTENAQVHKEQDGNQVNPPTTQLPERRGYPGSENGNCDVKGKRRVKETNRVHKNENEHRNKGKDQRGTSYEVSQTKAPFQSQKPAPTENAHNHSLSINCPICLNPVEDPKQLDKCGHMFCTACIDRSFLEYKPVCPSCNMVYGEIRGNQPDGQMDVGFSGEHLPGYEGHGTITITYYFPSGTQGDDHPNPGEAYKGTTRRAYLPDCREGKAVLKLLRKAFDRKLTFTIGRSSTTGQENVVTWNDVHHKTNKDGGPTRFGYPDQGYLTRVREELAAKGVKEVKEEKTETTL